MQRSNSKPQWNVVRQAPNGLYFLHYLDIEVTDTGNAIFQKLRDNVNLFALSNMRCGEWSVSISEYVVYAVTATRGSHTPSNQDPEAHETVCEVFIESKRYSEAYTRAIHDLTIFEGEKAPGFLLNRAQYSVAHRKGQCFEALLVVREIRQRAFVMIAAGLLLLALAVGLIVGCATGNTEWGVGVTAALFQVLTILQWPYIWCRRR